LYVFCHSLSDSTVSTNRPHPCSEDARKIVDSCPCREPCCRAVCWTFLGKVPLGSR
jgi:hypothetical protein